MKLENIVPWGRSLNEYKSMFSLTSSELDKKILGCGDGPASFNSELTGSRGGVVSVDPVYQFDSSQIRSRIDEVYPHIMSEMKKNMRDYIWKDIANIEDLGKTRMNAMEAFLDDYEDGKKAGRYIEASLPTLPFENKAFNLALCSH
ncbi:MAG: SAM-dependent methyltransferase, partial [Ghiorsea sp.]|nr:SAM-dependent methyltransferase [Ghiorsea sp.]